MNKALEYLSIAITSIAIYFPLENKAGASYYPFPIPNNEQQYEQLEQKIFDRKLEKRLRRIYPQMKNVPIQPIFLPPPMPNPRIRGQ